MRTARVKMSTALKQTLQKYPGVIEAKYEVGDSGRCAKLFGVDEMCAECGFSGSDWDVAKALDRLMTLPDSWATVTTVLDTADLGRRPRTDCWSSAEYTDHVRETTFGMRFLIDVAVDSPGTDLGSAPEPRFDPTPRTIDVQDSLRRFRAEVELLVARAASLDPQHWSSSAVMDGNNVDVLWIVRHAVHDLSHHLGDIEGIRRSFVTA